MVHNHGDVVGSKTIFGEGLLVVLGSSLSLSWSLCLGNLLGELLGLLHLHLSVQILELELSKDCVRVIKVKDLGIVDDEDETISLLEGNSGDASELLHADLHEGLSALLLTSVELVVFTLVLEFGHLLVVLVVCHFVVLSLLINNYLFIKHSFTIN